MLVLISLTVILTLMTIIYLLIATVSKKMIVDLQKSTPFECGFNPMSYPRTPFSIHFFLIAVIFLIFDIEIILIMPIILTFKWSMLKMWIISSSTFIIILTTGLIHEWKNGMLNWSI